MIYLELGLVLLFIAFNGFLAMSEMAIVSSRRGRLQAMADGGSARAALALKLAEDPGRFLSTVQIGITLVGVLAGVFSGATIAQRFQGVLSAWGVRNNLAEPLAYGVVVLGITYITLIVGELVPKRLALRNAEAMAVRVAGFMNGASKVALPLVWVLDKSSHAVLRLLGSGEPTTNAVTEEEVKTVIAEATTAGVVEPEEREMITSVMRLGDRSVKAIMTPRPDVEWVDISADKETIERTVRASGHSVLPAAAGTIDNFLGVIRAKAMLDSLLDAKPFDPHAEIEKVVAIPDTTTALDAIALLRESPAHAAIIVDEHGSFEGFVTATDILGAIVGELEDVTDGEAVRMEDGSWLLDGAMDLAHATDALGVPFPLDDDFHTVAGFIIAELRHIPKTAERFDWQGWRFEVVDMDGRRVDKVRARKLAETGK